MLNEQITQKRQMVVQKMTAMSLLSTSLFYTSSLIFEALENTEDLHSKIEDVQAKFEVLSKMRAV